jgi:hypothetical protein
MRRETNKVFQLPPGLFNHTILTTQDDAHTTQVANFRSTHDQRIDVETSASKNAGHARENSRFILNKTVQNMPSGH